MALIKTSNPALNQKIFLNGEHVSADEAMTLEGTVNKTGVLLVCLAAAAAWPWHVFSQTHLAASVQPIVLLGAFGGFIVALLTIFNKSWAPVTAPIYALLEGLALGGISTLFEVKYPGIAIQSVALTLGTLLVLLLAYRSGLIPVTQKLHLGIVSATGAIALLYFGEILLGFFGFHFAAINSASPIGIAFSVSVVIVAALNLILDFDFIESGISAHAPKYMEWYGAFGLIVTLVWLYLEILRLLSKTRSRN